ncbi:MAG: NTP transferase domain-containing protein [Propionibacteriaceae bacterium]|nr:NTP transferase domain-containing protein [Propionibacteriaceae bacterium]
MNENNYDAVILAGGQGTRLGGVSKADLQVQGQRLLDIVLRAAGKATVRVVVGDVMVPDDVVLTREEPPGTGPAAGLLAGVEAIASPAPWILVLACDLPGAVGAVARLLEALPDAPDEADGLCLRDAGGELQHLAAIYRTPALHRAFAHWGDPANRSVRGVMASLALLPVDPGDADLDDLDTPEQLARWTASHPAAPQNAEADDKEAWRAFVTDACAALGINADRVDEHAVLRLSRRVAHEGARPMAPVSAYVWGLALGTHPEADPDELSARLQEAIATAPIPEES